MLSPLTPDLVGVLGDMVGMPDAANAVIRMLEDPDTDHIRDAEMGIELLTALDADPEGCLGTDIAAEREALEGLCRSHHPGFWDFFQQCKMTVPLVERAEPPTDPGGSKFTAISTEKEEVRKGFETHWRRLAALYAPDVIFNTAESEVLNVIQRAVVDGKGWGLMDPAKGLHLSICLMPERIASNGKKPRLHAVKKAIPAMVRLGLLAFVGSGQRGRKRMAASWDPRICSDPEPVFRSAAQRDAVGARKAQYWRMTDDRMAKDPVSVKNQEVLIAIRAYEKERSSFPKD